MKTIALQLYTVRRALEADPGATLCRVKEAGYDHVETAPLPPGLSTHRLGELLRENGLTVTAVHGALPSGSSSEAIFEAVVALGARRLIWHGWPRDPECASLDGFRRLADRYSEAAMAARRHGLTFGIHNHWWEFEAIEGVYPYRLLHRILPEEIFFELDVYWIRTAALEPAAVVAELGARVTMLHLKDGPAVHGQAMTALGEGVVDIGSVLVAAPPNVAGIVELDECATDPLEAARRSREYLVTEAWRGC